eukprot:gnl/TRDRNA2_/TRDRNA2_155439_c0_seq1.p3 gnl/TRDRNA2_/TRDRNA2_155439_c0~~gnl/TRDRNA2_/TRDRNA2_155439_c0_seq1.p3  ORF type:complete len:114 (-),score=20.81 gnl/TRDRNA2_/TRDRNA2_155439_c0_seq1:124-465(-)
MADYHNQSLATRPSPEIMAEMGINQNATRKVKGQDIQLKLLQRRDPEAREMWTRYCKEHGQGKKDPAVHPAEFVQKFLDEYNAGNTAALGIDTTPLPSWATWGKGKGKRSAPY